LDDSLKYEYKVFHGTIPRVDALKKLYVNKIKL
jgi:hypothetical protein